MDTDLPILPLRIRVQNDGGFNPRVHLMDMWVADAPRTQMTAIIAPEPGRSPRVHRYIECGRLDLPKPLRDQIMLLCFQRLIREWLLWGYHHNRADVQNGVRWLERQLTPADAKIAIAEFTATQQSTHSTFKFHHPKHK